MTTSARKTFPVDFQAYNGHNDQTPSHQRSTQLPPSFSFLVIDQLNAPATFLVAHFISQALKQSRNVILLSGTHAQSHWNGLLQKQGIQLAVELNKGRFHFFDALIPIGLSDHLHQLTNCAPASIQSPLHGLFRSIRDAAKSATDAPILLIDDVTSFLWSGHSSQDLDIFLKHIRHLQHQLSMTVVTVFHSDLVNFLNKSPSSSASTDHAVVSEEGEKDTRLLHHLSAHSHVIMKTRNLGLQGAGELAVFRGPTLLSDFNLPVTVSYEHLTQYRIHDNTVTYQTKGLDKGFL